MNMIAPGKGKAGVEISHAAAPSQRPIVITAARGWPAQLANAVEDMRETAQLWRLAWTLSWLDIRLRYRGSLLGPFWLTLSTAVMIGAMGFLYARLFHADIHVYLPFLSTSLVLWSALSGLTGDGCTCFTQSESMLRAMRMPLCLHAARVVIRNFLIFLHNTPVIIVVFWIMNTVPSLAAMTMVPALMLWMTDAFFICLLLGVICARFRDIPPIVGSIMQIAFYVSPVLWSPAILVHRGIGTVLITWNPFFALLDIIRGPLLGGSITPSSWGVALGYSAILIMVSMIIFARARARVTYWV
jgi:lipopolysaccharide transport system permease protein